jgi:rhodanese-related sulfurtransferase
MTAASKLGAAALVLGLAAPFAGSPYRHARGRIDVGALAAQVAREEDHVTALELGTWIKDRKAGLRVIDVRTPEEFATYALPTAENLPLAVLDHAHFDPKETVVLYSEGGAHAAQAWVFLKALGVREVYFLRGGLNEWLDEVMNPAKGSEVTRYFGGVPRGGTASARPESASEAISRLRRRGC